MGAGGGTNRLKRKQRKMKADEEAKHVVVPMWTQDTNEMRRVHRESPKSRKINYGGLKHGTDTSDRLTTLRCERRVELIVYKGIFFLGFRLIIQLTAYDLVLHPSQTIVVPSSFPNYCTQRFVVALFTRVNFIFQILQRSAKSLKLLADIIHQSI